MIEYLAYQGDIDYIIIKPANEPYLQLHNYVTLDWDFKGRKVTILINKIKRFRKKLLSLGEIKDIRLFIRATKGGRHVIIAYNEEFKNFYKKDIPFNWRTKFHDDSKRLVWDKFRVEALHFMPYKPGILFDVKDSNYTIKYWVEVDLD